MFLLASAHPLPTKGAGFRAGTASVGGARTSFDQRRCGVESRHAAAVARGARYLGVDPLRRQRGRQAVVAGFAPGHRHPIPPARALQHVLKAEAARPEATDRSPPAMRSPGVGPMGAGYPADAGPADDRALHRRTCRRASSAYSIALSTRTVSSSRCTARAAHTSMSWFVFMSVSFVVAIEERQRSATKQTRATAGAPLTQNNDS